MAVEGRERFVSEISHRTFPHKGFKFSTQYATFASNPTCILVPSFNFPIICIHVFMLWESVGNTSSALTLNVELLCSQNKKKRKGGTPARLGQHENESLLRSED